MKLLFVAPPQKGDYYNLCYNFTEFGEIAAYAKNLDFVDKVDLVDLSVLPKKDYAPLKNALESEYDSVVVWNRFENIIELNKILELIDSKQKNAKTVTYGQPSSIIPGHFSENYKFDAILCGGPWEIGLENYLSHVNGIKGLNDVSGVLVKDGESYAKTKDIVAQKEPFWVFSDLSMLPLEDYFRIYDEEDNIAGISHKKEISFSVSKGCQIKCNFCNVHKVHGNKEIRQDLSYVVDYLDNNFKKYGFDFVSIFSPIFTLDKDYAINFSNKMKERGIDWKCVTSPKFVDDEVIAAMSKGGCQRIGFGIETLNKDAQKYIKKGVSKEQIKEVVGMCKKNNVEPLMFLMLGIPGETRKSFVSTVRYLNELGAKMRITAYTPYYELRDSMTTEEVADFNRRTISSGNIKGLPREEFMRIIKNFNTWKEQVL